MGVVYLVRHGQASFGEMDYDRLSELGARQAELLGLELRRRRVVPAEVVSGSLKRQLGTAERMLAAAGLGLVPSVDPRWNEYDHLEIVNRHGVGSDDEEGIPGAGAADAAGRAEASRSFQASLDAALLRWAEELDEDLAADETSDVYAPPGKAETWSRFHHRVRSALAELIGRQERGTTAVVVTSGGVIAALCAQLLGLGPQGFVALNRVGTNGGVTKVLHGRSGTSLVTFNDHSHLEVAGRDLVTYR